MNNLINHWQINAPNPAFYYDEPLPYLRLGGIQNDHAWHNRHPAMALIWLQQGELVVKHQHQEFLLKDKGLYLNLINQPVQMKVISDTALQAVVYRLDLLALVQYRPYACGTKILTQSQTIEPLADNLPIIELLNKLSQLNDCPNDKAVLSKLWHSELHYRLMRSDCGLALDALLFSDKNARQLLMILQHIKQHFAQKLNFDTLAQTHGLSRSVFYRKFKDLTGLSPLQYQKIHRLSYAQTLLNDPHKSITWIAQEIGYESVSQFSREYKRMFGISPSGDY